MSPLDSKLLDHPVRATLTSLNQVLQGLPDEVLEQVNEVGPKGSVDRALSALDYIEGLLATADPALVPQATLDAIRGPLDQALNAASSLGADPATHIGALNQAIESAIQQAAPLAGLATGFAQQTKKLGRRLGGALTVKVKELEGEAEMIADELKELEQRRKSGLDELGTEQEQQRAALSRRLDELNTTIESEKQQAASLSAAFQEQFSAAQEERQSKFEQQVAEVEQRAEKIATDLEKRATKSLENVQGVQKKVGELYSVVTGTSTAGAFHDEATEQATAADRWRLIAIGFGTAAALIAVVGVALVAAIGVSAPAAFAKLTATVACGVIATYAGRQSTHHRGRADAAKDLELELVAAEGFLYSLQPDEQRELRKDYFKRAFRGRLGPESSTKSESPVEFGLTPDLLNALTALLKAGQAHPS